jgi:hypothetical protein
MFRISWKVIRQWEKAVRVYIISSILIILGLVAIALGDRLPEGHSALTYLRELSSVFLVGGVLAILFRVFHDRAYEANLRRLLRIHDSVDELGLVEILPEVQDFNFTDIINDRDHLSVLMNDGLRWIGNNAVPLQERFSKNTLTEFFLIDPDSNFVKVLAGKVGEEPDNLKKKIQDAWQRVIELYEKSEMKGQVKIYKVNTFPTRSIFLSEDELIETPYQTASGRARIPVFVYKQVPRKDAPYYFAKNDILALRKESDIEIERPSNKGMQPPAEAAADA